MKAKIDAIGDLIVEPESELELYALNQWAKENMILINDESYFSSIVIGLSAKVDGN